MTTTNNNTATTTSNTVTFKALIDTMTRLTFEQLVAFFGDWEADLEQNGEDFPCIVDFMEEAHEGPHGARFWAAWCAAHRTL